MTDLGDAETEKALTLHQPWAELILRGRKTVELRAWPPTYVGRIWLHAGLRAHRELDDYFAIQDVPRGAFVGSVEIVAATALDARRWRAWQPKHLDPGPYQPGYWAWTLGHPRRLVTPLPAAGQRGLFTPEPDLLSRLQAAPSTSSRS